MHASQVGTTLRNCKPEDRVTMIFAETEVGFKALERLVSSNTFWFDVDHDKSHQVMRDIVAGVKARKWENLPSGNTIVCYLKDGLTAMQLKVLKDDAEGIESLKVKKDALVEAVLVE